MMKLFAIVTLLWTVSFSLLAEEGGLNCRLRTIAEAKSYLLGEPLDMELVLWPKQALQLGALLKQLSPGSLLVDSFYINKIAEVKKSENNVDAVVLKLEVVPLKPFDIAIMPFYTDGTNSCTLEIKGFSFVSEKIKPQISILEQPSDPLPTPSRLWLQIVIGLLVVLILLGIAWGVYKFWQRKREREKITLRKEYFKTLIENAKSRREIERFYLLRDEWEKLICSKNGVEEFYSKITPILYKKEWSDGELDSVSHSLEKLAGGFDD
jgi:hypothetical protein